MAFRSGSISYSQFINVTEFFMKVYRIVISNYCCELSMLTKRGGFFCFQHINKCLFLFSLLERSNLIFIVTTEETNGQ